MDLSLSVSERFERHLARWLMRLPGPIQVKLSGQAPIRHDGDVLHPELQLILATRKLRGISGLCDVPPADARARMRRDRRIHANEPIAVRTVRDFTVAGSSHRIPVRHYSPPGTAASAPLVVYLHGGGFVLGDLESHDSVCRLLCQRARVHVLAVDYRLAPESPFPAGLEDARAAYAWAASHAASLGADPERIAIAGDSSGANLATVVTQQLAREGGKLPVLQLLIYPVVDRSDEYASYERFAEGFLLTRKDIETFRAHYLSGVDPSLGLQPMDPRLLPLRAPDLRGLPPTVVVTASFDPLRDEGEAYAGALSQAGVRVTLKRQPGMIHGFINIIDLSPSCRSALEEIADLFASHLPA